MWYSDTDSRLEDFRKESPEKELGITPTYLRREPTSNLDDYGKKGSITTKLTGGNGAESPSGGAP